MCNFHRELLLRMPPVPLTTPLLSLSFTVPLQQTELLFQKYQITFVHTLEGWPTALVCGGSGNADPAAAGPGSTATGVGEHSQSAVQKNGSHRGHH